MRDLDQDEFDSLPRPLRGRPLLVGFSGGADSLALLLRLQALGRAGALGPLCVLHVDHGLHPDSSRWAEHCRVVCDRLGLPLQVVRLDLSNRIRPGNSPETLAREARYAALSEQLADGGVLVTGHHRDDQAETFLRHALRGSGPRGLSGMPVLRPFAGGWHWRPLLGYDRDSLRAFIAARGFEPVEDPSNADTGPDRNYLRHAVLEPLKVRWPNASAALARSARHAAEAESLLGDLARIDLAACAGRAPETLAVRALGRLSAARQRNLLRYWIATRGLPAPPEARLETLRGQLDARRDAQLLVRWPGAEVRRYRDELFARPPDPPRSDFQLQWDLSTPLALPDGRVLQAVTGSPGEGLDPMRLAEWMQADGWTLTVRNRQPGDRIRPRGSPVHRRLKNLFQEAGIPPWERDRIWVIEVAGEIVQVGHHWVAESMASPGRTAGLIVRESDNLDCAG
ncbi:MAG: tRNA lysidine(34) synthetase TilS [Halothiobacillaceae bacterium]